MSISIQSLLFNCSVVSDSFATPWIVACQAPLSMGFPRQEYWGGLPVPSPGDLPDPGMLFWAALFYKLTDTRASAKALFLMQKVARLVLEVGLWCTMHMGLHRTVYHCGRTQQWAEGYAIKDQQHLLQAAALTFGILPSSSSRFWFLILPNSWAVLKSILPSHMWPH